MKRAFTQRQIPTLFGLGILIAGLVGGILFIGIGGGEFAPRATPQTTPKSVKITNIRDTSFTVSFLTDEATAGFVKYDTTATDLKNQASDDRDQLNGNVGQYQSHYITLRDLEPGTEYHFTLGTASIPRTDNNGVPFTVKTAPRAGNQAAAKTAYGIVNKADGTAADGAIVYMVIPGGTELSGLVKTSGSWAIPLSNARTTDLTTYVTVQPSTPVSLIVQGTAVNETASLDLTIADSQPVSPIILVNGSGSAPTQQRTNLQAETSTPPATTENDQTSLTSLSSLGTTASPEASASSSPTISPSPEGTPTTQQASTVDMTMKETPTVETTRPTITGKAAPNTVITIQVNSDTKITTQLTTDAQGNFVLPLSGGETHLEPGEHTVTVTYTDPTTGKEKTEVKTFFVSADNGLGRGGNPESSSTLLAQINPSPTPFGTENPFTIPSPSPSVSPSASASASASPRVAMPPTTSEVPRSGSVGTTIALLVGGAFMIAVGIWSYHHNTAQAIADAATNADFELDSEDESL
jgi:hypothetical protein